jgi:hypothetical protein
MKFILVGITVFLIGCAQLIKGQQQTIIEKNFKERVYFTTCSGAVEDWGSCNQKAQSTCLNGYSVLEKFENAVGGRRELTFQCKD